MRVALARHDEILRGAIAAHGGYLVKMTGDGAHAAFRTAERALAAAIAAQRSLGAEAWVGTGPLRVRMGLHTSAAEARDGDYYGSSVNRAARVMSAAHGGQVIVSRATEEVARDSLPDGVELVDLGEHRLRDLARAERLFQVCVPGLVVQFPALRSLETFPGNLPVQLTSFVGRGGELSAIAKALKEWRLVTVTGVGGVGKTRLATQAAGDMLPRFADGAWFCELAAAGDAEAMVQVVASTLGVNPRQGLTLEGSTVEFLRTKRLLILLDNCEHLLAPAARLVEDVLRTCTNVRVLATSREGLGVDGEHMLALRSLGTPGAHDELGQIQSSDAVQLFLERALAAQADFVLDETSAAAVAEICRRLDGIPLAIELAAARVVALSPAEIADRLDERFRLLTGGRRTAVERHQTLRATVDWSYSMLDKREQAVFDRLGVFAGSFDAPAAEAIASDHDFEAWDVIDALMQLASKSMVVVERDSDVTRYQLLETLRAYARDRLDTTDEVDVWRRRHAAYYASLAEESGRGLLTSDERRLSISEELTWRRRVRQELDNLRAAAAWSLDRHTQTDNEFGVRIIAALAQLALEDRPSGIGEWAEGAITVAQSSAPHYRTAVLGAAAESLRNRGELTAAHALARDAVRDGVPAACQAGHVPFIVLSVVEATIGSTEQAFRYASEGVAALEEVGDNPFGHCILQGVAAMWAVETDPSTAEAYATAALEFARNAGNPTLLATTLYTYAWVTQNRDPRNCAGMFEPERRALKRRHKHFDGNTSSRHERDSARPRWRHHRRAQAPTRRSPRSPLQRRSRNGQRAH
jgi:predicted ATPase